MKSNTLAFALVATVALAAGNGAALGQEAATLSLKEILHKTVASEKRLEKSLLKYTSRQQVKVEELDDEGRVEETKRFVYKSFPVGDRRFNRMIEKDGKPLQGDDLEEENEREQEFREAASEGKAPDEKKQGRFSFDEAFIAKYDFALAGRKALGHREVYVLTFKPKAGELPEEDMKDRFFNRTRGRLWVDAEDFVIAKAHTVLVEPVKVLGGIMAKIEKMEFTFVRSKKNGEWLPSAFYQKIKGRKLLSSFNNRVTVRMGSFERLE